MRNFQEVNAQSFIYQCEKNLKEYSEIFYRSTASDSPKWLHARFENSVILKSRKQEDLVLLAMFSYYIPEEIGVLLRLELQEEADRNPEMDVLHFLLRGKGAMYCFLLETKLWHSRDFFGNVITKQRLEKLRTLFKLKFSTTRKPKRAVRHRGYRDKGTLRNIHEYHSFVSFTKEMNELEDARQVRKDTLALLQGFLE